MQYQLRISENHRSQLYDHLFPGDGKEAVAVALCGHHIRETGVVLLVHKLHLIPHEKCERHQNYVHWKTEVIIDDLEEADSMNLSLIKFHSHPTGYSQFSELDDESDGKLFPSVYGWVEGNQPHASCVMLPSRKFFGRVVDVNGKFHTIDIISIIGDRILSWSQEMPVVDQEVNLRNQQTLGDKTIQLLKKMKIGVVGASGTGSPTIEQLARLGVGELVIIDPDKVEKKNLNRILNTHLQHAKRKEYKVDVLKDAIEKFGFGTNVHAIRENLYDSLDAIDHLISCDMIFGCVDSVDGRHLLNQISTFYLVPYLDMGVKLDADGKGGINQINGAIHWIKPGGSSLLTRGVYNSNALEAAALMRQNPEEYERRAKEKYIVNLPVESPAVIPINMLVSSYAVLEFLDRIHPLKANEADERSINWLLITEGMIIQEKESEVDHYLKKRVGRGDIKPFLEMPELS